MGFKTNKCCCGDTHGLATMWILDFDTGAIVRDFNYVHAGSPVSVACASDYFETAEASALVNSLWNPATPESRIWGPNANSGAQGPIGGFTDSYFWHGRFFTGASGGPSGGGQLRAFNRSDGSAYTHGMLGNLQRVEDGYVYTVSTDGLVFRKYEEDGTLVATGDMTGQANGSYPTYSGEGLHFARDIAAGSHNLWDTVDPVSMSHTVDQIDIDVSGLNPASVFGNDESGGLLMYRSGMSNMIEYWTSGTSPDWTGVAAYSGFTYANPPIARFGRNHSVYGVRTISSIVNLTRITTTDGSVVWDLPLPSGLDAASIVNNKTLLYEGTLYIACVDSGVWAIDEASGAELWYQDTVHCGYGLPVATPLGVLCCGEYM